MFHGELWVGTFEHGLARVTLDGAARGAAPLPAAYGLAQVNQLEPRAQPALELVLATARGLVHLDAHGGARRVTRADGLAGEQVAAVAARGERAAVATNRGLTLLDPTTGPRSLGPVQGLANAHATAVVWLDDRHLAVGTLGGLTFVRAAPGETPRVERTVGAGPGALPAGWVSALAATPEGLYVGTYGGGLALVAPDGALVPLPAPTRGRVRVNPGAIFVTDEAVLVGTLDHGLLVVDRASRRVSPAALPLGSANVTAVAVAGDALWVGTDQGLVRVAAPARFAAR
jgi:ligand-binding sensor domain-containing protein